jgi:hypothetical protein
MLWCRSLFKLTKMLQYAEQRPDSLILYPNFCFGLLTFGKVFLCGQLVEISLESSGGLGYYYPRPCCTERSLGRISISQAVIFLPKGFGASLTRTVIVLHPVPGESSSASYLGMKFRKRLGKGGGKPCSVRFVFDH